MKIIIDCGHTLSGAGTGAKGVVSETDKNREVGKRLMAMLQEKGHTVVNATVDYSNNDLADRVAIANKHQDADLFISLHLNAFNGSAYGVETYIYNGSWSDKSRNKTIAQAIQNQLATIWSNRGVKEANFYVLRETVAPAVLVELGFCDNREDMNKWNTEKIAKALFKGITGADYIASTPTPSGEVKYRVVCGTYSSKANAEAQQKRLKEKGFDSFLVAIK